MLTRFVVLYAAMYAAYRSTARRPHRRLARRVPRTDDGTGRCAATALLTFLSGFLYMRWGAEGFWVMAALCATALPLSLKLRP